MISLDAFKKELPQLLEGNESACATLKGSALYPYIQGIVRFYQLGEAVLVIAEVENLPEQTDCGSVFAFHIHEGNSCGGEDFSDTKGHYNPSDCLHPYHAGDLPPLFSNGGTAWMAVQTNRFTVEEIEGHTVVIHERTDDFMTQPSGNAGRKIACGVIV